jgi:hypothetical protein
LKAACLIGQLTLLKISKPQAEGVSLKFASRIFNPNAFIAPALRQDTGRITMKQLRITLSFCLLIDFAQCLTFAQEAGIDTLYYFDPDTIDLYPIYTADIDSASIFFTPDSSWEYFEILELHFLFTPGLTDSANSFFEGDVFIRSDEVAGQPGRVLARVPVQVAGAQETYPNWKVISLLDHPAVKNLQGNFWLEGNSLLACVRSWSMSNHSFVHSLHALLNWHTSLVDMAARAVVKQQQSLGITDRTAKGSNVNKVMIHNYPNPFNASTIIQINNMALETRSSIRIYNVHGQIMTVLFDGMLGTGIQQFKWKGLDSRGVQAPSGVYYCYVVAGEHKFYRKLILIR